MLLGSGYFDVSINILEFCFGAQLTYLQTMGSFGVFCLKYIKQVQSTLYSKRSFISLLMQSHSMVLLNFQ
jgi:hypothetical protein